MAGRAASSRVPQWVEPMLAKVDGGRLQQGPEWAYEYKLDGYRACMQTAADGTTMLTSRNGIDFTHEFADLAGVLAPALDGRPAVLDGEIVTYNQNGQIDFGLLQERRGRYQTHRASTRRTEPFDDAPVRFLAFDLLQLGTTSLLREPYEKRRAQLAALSMPDPYRVSVVRGFTFTELAADRRTPQDLLDHVAATGHEGLVAKLLSSPYLPGKRPAYWLKHALIQTTEVIICGWRPGQNRLSGSLGGLLLGGHDPDTGELVYIGDVGTGFSQAARAQLLTRLEAIERRRHPFAVTPPREDTVRAHWVQPELVGEVVFRQFTRGAGRLRHTSWRGLRKDRKPADVLAPHARERVDAETAPAPGRRSTPRGNEPSRAAAAPAQLGPKVTVQAGNRRLTLSNLDKPLYPSGFTKGEVVHYYSHVAEVLLPHLAGRPVTFIRFPDGVGEGKQQFFEKNVPNGAPDWLPTVALPSTGSRSGRGEGTITYALLEELAALVWAANMAALELHVPQWQVDRAGGRRPPDRLVFDLDPGPGTSIVDCCRVAERLRELLAAGGLTAFAKTSGSKGMQLYCGISTDDPATPSAYAKKLAQQLARETPETVTAVMANAQRTGRVFIDWSQNNPAKTTIAPYSLRGRDHPTASTPITWAEVEDCSHVAQLTFTAEDVLDRVQQHGDLLAELDETRAPLPAR
ncbi:DNA ligase D [Amycolatopsis australiensis]|uniref:DNA ligase (ATP) n=1 Tax=Amycolatopsis australiensis TaxID=546364 RepID=A0A1K1SX44_9PSEU|nr:DNA ligase D [Amycolatopsis australiensis]SFW88421.1 ATP-dependent DNA ligase LigD phosphoesterase module /ATP-dependent DNA ligase LigD polymerase module [Amycolatopsis australiensis]